MAEPFAAAHAAALTTGFSGVISVRTDDEVVFRAAYGDADRGRGLPNTLATRFGIASGTKTFAALTVMRLVERGELALATRARELLGPDLRLIDDAVTVEQLLGHTSGIGDYLDEDVIDNFEVWHGSRPPTDFTSTAAYLSDLDGHAQKFAPGRAFSYCNGGYVVLALLAERATGTPWPDLVAEHVTERAGLVATEYLDVNRLPADTAIGYLDDGRTNAEILPAQGSGDGGLWSTLDDIDRLWQALFSGRLVSADTRQRMLTPGPYPAGATMRYGLGFWLDPDRSAVVIEGCDAGISVRSTYDPEPRRATTVMANSTDGAWPVARALADITAAR